MTGVQTCALPISSNKTVKGEFEVNGVAMFSQVKAGEFAFSTGNVGFRVWGNIPKADSFDFGGVKGK